MAKSASQLESDVKWWEEELRIRKAKVQEAERTLEQRKRELSDARRDEQSKREKAKSPTAKKY